MAKKSKPNPANKAVPPAPTMPVDAPTLFDKPWLPQALLFLAAIAVFGWAVPNAFVYFDDDKAILYNQTLQHPSLSKFFTGQNLGMYAPMTWIAYWIGHTISGQEAWGYHLLGVLLHGLNAVLAFSVLRLLTGRSWPAFFAALLFAVHPVQTEAVAWAAALSTVLFATFYLGSLLAYVRWAKSAAPHYLGISLLLFLLACLAKSAAVTLPLVLVALDLLFFKNLKGKFWYSKIPYVALSLAFGLYTFSTRAQEGHDIETASAVFSAPDRFFMVCQTLLFYPFKLLVPLGFSIAYPFYKTGGAWSWEYYAAPLALAAIGYLVWRKLRRRPEALLACCLYVLPLTVMLPFRTVGSFELRSDRYVYLSCLGIFFGLALLLEKQKPVLRNGIMAAAALLFAVLAYRQTQVWKNGVQLFKNCVDITPDAPLCQCNLAYNELLSLDFQNCVKHYTEALRLDGSYVEAYNGRGQAYFQLKQFQPALEDFTKAIQGGLVSPKLFQNRGKCLVILGRHSDAIPDLGRSAELEPKAAETFYFRAVAKEKTGDVPGALADYGTAIALKPDYVEALVNRGLLHFNNKQLEEAVQDYSLALQANPNLAIALNNRAFAYLNLGRLDRALADANKVLEINPNYVKGYETRGRIYLALGKPDKAQADFAHSQQLQNTKR